MSKIDEMIATRVMGWTKKEIGLAGNLAASVQFHIESQGIPKREAMAVDAMRSVQAEQQGSGKTFLPQYSTEIAAAWEVVEKMRSKHDGWVGFQQDAGPGIIHKDVVYKHQARFFFAGCGAFDFKAHANTAPLAICIAALLAVGVTQSEIDEAMKG